jgi:acetyl-CoA C-acetyltransferase
MYEAMGLTDPGQGARALEEGWVFKDGKLPINVSGGLKAKGHPVGATGVSQHVIAAMQLASPRRAAVQNMGGVGIANYVSVLEAV